MRKLVWLILPVLIISMVTAKDNPPDNYGLDIVGINLIRKGITHPFELSDSGFFKLDIACTQDTGNVDIVFILDTTGSMSGTIRAAVANIREFADTMEATGYDYALNIVTYGDGQNFPHGFDCTTDIETFHSWMAPIGSGGGADGPEMALDAINAAMDSIHWRSGALRVIILLTDAPFCVDSSICTFACTSRVNPDTIMHKLMDGAFMLFTVSPSPLYSSSCMRLPPSYCEEWYKSVAESTGGEWFRLGTSFSSIYNSMLDKLGVFQLIEGYVANNTPYKQRIASYLSTGFCIRILRGENPVLSDSISPGDIAHFLWRINYTVGCIGASGCFTIDASSAMHSVRGAGCMYIPDCNCSPVEAHNIWPETGVWSGCDPQEIRIALIDDDAGINVSTIEFAVNGEIYEPNTDPRLEFEDSILTFTPDPGQFPSGERIDYGLLDVYDLGGCTLSAPITNWFRLDLDPPILENVYPHDNNILGSVPEIISVNISDLLSGLDNSSIKMTVNGDEYRIDDPAVTFEDGKLNLHPIGIYDWGKSDTIEVCVNAADNVTNDYCGPNESSICWNFFIDNLYLFFRDTTLEPGATVRYTLYCDDPFRFSITDFSVGIRFNPEIVSVLDVKTNGTAADSFTVNFDASRSGYLQIDGNNITPMLRNIKFIDIELLINNNAPGASFTPMLIDTVILLDGTVGYYSDDATIFVRWNTVSWLQHLIFHGFDPTDGYLDRNVMTIGCSYSATDGYDPLMDIFSSPTTPELTEVYIWIDDPLYPHITRLERDLRNTSSIPSTWIVMTVDKPGSLYWNPRLWPDGIFTLNNYIDMREDSIYFYSADENLVIEYSQPEPGATYFDLCNGWNLLSSPVVINMPNWTESFEEIFAGPFAYDPILRNFYIVSRTQAGQGFWIYSSADKIITIGGVPVNETIIPIVRGWNLVGAINESAEFTTEPPDLIVPSSIFRWDCDSKLYIVVEPDAIEPGIGYWILSSGNGFLQIKPK